MPNTIRFHLDESCRQSIARGLRLHGLDVTTPVEAELLGATDRDQLAFARREQRVVVTHDSDFVALAQAGEEHAGIVYCHQGLRSVGEIIRGLLLIWEMYEPDEMKCRVEYV